MLRVPEMPTNNEERVGVMEYYYGTSDPPFGLICDGRKITYTTYPKLTEFLNTVNQTGNPRADINIPDCRGYFLRGLGGNSARMNTEQLDAIVNITGTAPNGDSNSGHDAKFTGAFYVSYKAGSTAGKSSIDWDNPMEYFDASRVVRTANEVRPINKAFNVIITHGEKSTKKKIKIFPMEKIAYFHLLNIKREVRKIA